MKITDDEHPKLRRIETVNRQSLRREEFSRIDLLLVMPKMPLRSTLSMVATGPKCKVYVANEPWVGNRFIGFRVVCVQE